MVLGPVLGLALALRLSRIPRFLLAGGTVLFFVVLTGGGPSVMRAGVMAGLTLFGVLLGRPRSAASILAGRFRRAFQDELERLKREHRERLEQ